MTSQFVQHADGDILPASDWNANFLLTQQSLSDLSPLIISGLTLSAGAGLAVTVAAGVAVIGARVTASGSFSIAGLANGTTNHLFLRDDGVGLSNTTGTQPADTVKLGTATTSGGAVTSTNILRDSGRQAKVRSESLVPGGPSAGNPASINLAAWAAAAANSVTVYGTLPTGALPAIAFDDLSDVTLTSQARGDIVYRGASAWLNRAAGTSGYFLKTQGAGADPVWAALPTTLSGDVTLAPSSSSRNVIQPTGDAVTGLVLKAHSATHGDDIFQIQKSDGTVVAGFGYATAYSYEPQFFLGAPVPVYRQPTSFYQYQSSAAAVAFTLEANPSASNDIMDVFGGSGAYLFSIGPENNSGQIVIMGGSATANDIACTIQGSSGQTTTTPVFKVADYSFKQKFAVRMDGRWDQWGESSTTTRQMTECVPSWATSTDASRKARLVVNIWDTAAREALRLEASGSAAMLGFLGASAIARPSAYTLAGSATRSMPTDPSASYSGQDNLQAGSVYAKSADLETLRAVVSSLEGVVRQLIADFTSYGLLQ